MLMPLCCLLLFHVGLPQGSPLKTAACGDIALAVILPDVGGCGWFSVTPGLSFLGVSDRSAAEGAAEGGARAGFTSECEAPRQETNECNHEGAISLFFSITLSAGRTAILLFDI